MTIIWCMVPEKWSVDEQNFLSFWTIFCTFTPLTTWKIKLLKKMKKLLGDIITLHLYTISDNHMMYGSGDMELWSLMDRIFCHCGPFFCLFTLLTTQNIKILKNLKKTPGGIIILHKCAKNHDHMLYCCWDKDLIVIFHFGLGLALLPNSPINEN